jgi:hypothetical protein
MYAGPIRGAEAEMMTVATIGRPVRKDTVAYSVVPGKQLFLLDIGSDVYYSSNGVGAFIWDLCDGMHTVMDIIRGVAQEFAVSLPHARKDVLNFLGDLEREGLIV